MTRNIVGLSHSLVSLKKFFFNHPMAVETLLLELNVTQKSLVTIWGTEMTRQMPLSGLTEKLHNNVTRSPREDNYTGGMDIKL